MASLRAYEFDRRDGLYMRRQDLKHVSPLGLILLILAALILVIGPPAVQAQTQEKSTGEKARELTPSESGAETAFIETQE